MHTTTQSTSNINTGAVMDALTSLERILSRAQSEVFAFNTLERFIYSRLLRAMDDEHSVSIVTSITAEDAKEALAVLGSSLLQSTPAERAAFYAIERFVDAHLISERLAKAVSAPQQPAVERAQSC